MLQRANKVRLPSTRRTSRRLKQWEQGPKSASSASRRHHCESPLPRLPLRPLPLPPRVRSILHRPLLALLPQTRSILCLLHNKTPPWPHTAHTITMVVGMDLRSAVAPPLPPVVAVALQSHSPSRQQRPCLPSALSRRRRQHRHQHRDPRSALLPPRRRHLQDTLEALAGSLPPWSASRNSLPPRETAMPLGLTSET